MIGHRFIYTSEITGCTTEGIVAFQGRYITSGFNPFTGKEEKMIIKLITSTNGITYEKTDVTILEKVLDIDPKLTFLIT